MVTTVYSKLPNAIVFNVGSANIKINGFNNHNAVIVLINGAKYAVTSNVDAGAWEAINKKYEDLSVLKSGLIFAQEKTQEAEAEGADKAGEKTGLEGESAEKETDSETNEVIKVTTESEAEGADKAGENTGLEGESAEKETDGGADEKAEVTTESAGVSKSKKAKGA